MTRGEADDARRVLRALAVTRTAASDLPEVLGPAHRLDQRAAARLGLAPVLPPSWRVKAANLLEGTP